MQPLMPQGHREVPPGTPSWVNSLGERLLPQSPTIQRWSKVQNHLAPLASLLDVEIVLIDAAGYCVGGTGPYVAGLGVKVPADNALAYSLQSGQSTMVLNPRKDLVCLSCSGREQCTDTANFTGPIVVQGHVLAVVQIVAFTDQQRARLLVKAEKAFELIKQIITLACAPGEDDEAQDLSHDAATESHALSTICPDIIGESQAMRRLKKSIIKAAATDTTVLIQGESGTGKELVAQAIHEYGPRKAGPFVAINCGAIPESLMESELFGYEGGAFSGASTMGKKGLLEQAHGGSFFLDEVSEMPAALQVKLLRVLQERRIRRIGGKGDQPLDVRIIAASNKNLRAMVLHGSFREDLLFRLDVLPLQIPPLREREGDIRLLVAHYLEVLSKQKNRTFRVTTELMHRFESHWWPGNVRELRNFVEYGMTLCDNDVLTLDLLQPRFDMDTEPKNATHAPGIEQPYTHTHNSTSPSRSTHSAQQENLAQMVQQFGNTTKGKKLLAAHLGISLATLYRRLKICNTPH